MAAKKKSAAKSRSKAAKPKAKKKVVNKATKKKAVKKAAKKVVKKVAKKKVAARAKRKPVRRAARPAMPSPELAAIDQRIAIIRNNLRDLAEQATATTGSGTEDVLSDRIASQEAELQRLSAERDVRVKGG